MYAMRKFIEKLGKQFIAAAADPQLKSRFVDIGIEPMPMAPCEFASSLAKLKSGPR
jgi:hypothetical protein